MEIQSILERAINLGASDVHLTVGKPPVYRRHGELKPDSENALVLQNKVLESFARDVMDDSQWETFQEEGQVDFAYSLSGIGRFRISFFRQRGSIAVALRIVNSQIQPLDDLGLPPVIHSFLNMHRGLVIVAGPVASGKSTTLAAIVDNLNSEKNYHIITLEDPIELLHKHKQSIVNQREIGSDSKSFADGVKSALRQDPDVLVISEMRDMETINAALAAAESKCLVFAAVRTNNSVQTIDRIVDVFPPHHQQQVRIQLSEVLQGIIAQQLVPRLDKPEMVPAVEVMLAVPAIRNLIREGKTYQIISVMQTANKQGMATMDSALKHLYQKGIISREELIFRGYERSGI
ncbi:MAG: type IV pilus twitching motility protein PilT [Bacillota bacterium]